MKCSKIVTVVIVFVLIVLSFITSCGHLLNPAPPKEELISTKDQDITCEDIIMDILDLQAKQGNVQYQIDQQRTNNITSGVLGVLFGAPILILIDPTTQKNEAHNSYQEREEYLRKLASDKGCTNLPKPLNKSLRPQQKQTAFIPSGGNVKQDGASRKFTKPTRVTEDGYKVWEIVGKGMDIDFYQDEAEGRPILGKDIAVGDSFIVQGKEFKLLKNSGWMTYYNENKSIYEATRPSMKPIGIRAPKDELVVITVLKQPQK
jgi:hypothetical protein